MPAATPSIRAEPLVLAYRGPVLENAYYGHAVAYDVYGKRLFHLGNSARLTPVRSCLKPFQALPILMDEVPAHLRPTDEELALMSGSHAAEPRHIETVRGILLRAGLAEGDLGCGPQDGRSGGRILNNCSGKHSGMLLYCAARGIDPRGYLRPDHPVQERILTEVLRLSRSVRPEVPVVMDGCGAPVPALPLEKIAWLFAQLVRPSGLPQNLAAALTRVANAMRTHPFMISGTGRFDTRVTEASGGRLIAKCGADGLSCIADRDTGIGLVVKCEAPDIPMAQLASLRLARKLEMMDEPTFCSLEAEFSNPRLNTNRDQVGDVRVVAELS